MNNIKKNFVWNMVGATVNSFTSLIFMIVVNFGLGNILEPRIEGKNLGLSPFVILVCLSLWGYIWGFVGMILAVPMTVIIKIICENTDYLKSIGILLGNGNDIDIKQK